MRFFKQFGRPRTLLLALLGILTVFGQNIFAQNVEIFVKVLPTNKIEVKGKFAFAENSFRNWTFLKNYADAENLGERIENPEFFDKNGRKIASEKLFAGEFQAGENPLSWNYTVNLPPSPKITDAAHVSWLTNERGLLMLADILPENFGKDTEIQISFDLPAGFKVLNNSAVNVDCRNCLIREKNGRFAVTEAEKAIFVIGRDWREHSPADPGKNNDFKLAIAGEWAFSDAEAVEMVNSVAKEYRKLFDAEPRFNSRIVLSPFPQETAGSDRWRAETRGSTVTIISGKIPQKSVALQRLHEQLRHEILHLWLPNGVNLGGDYAWFYEGFSIYQALRTGVELNQIRFEDYLRTLSLAFEIVRKDTRGKNVSLLDISQNRWAGANNYIYAKGLLVAFLADVALLRESGGKRGLKNVFRTVYEKHKYPAQRQDGNTAILSILKSYPELVFIAQNYVQGTAEINLQDYLEAAGLEMAANSAQIRVKEKLGGRQKDLLDDLGYNQWRKLLQQKK